MFKKRAQGLSVNVIIVAIIGLIILVVVIALFTGKISKVSERREAIITCESSCGAIGYDDFFSTIFDTAQECKGRNDDDDVIGIWKYFPLLGSYGDVSEGKVCCCRKDLQ